MAILFISAINKFPNSIGPAYPFAQSVMMLKIAHRASRAIFVGGTGLEPRLIDCLVSHKIPAC